MLTAIAEYLDDQDIAVLNKTNETRNQIYLGQIQLSKDTCIGLYEDLTVTEVRNIGTNEAYKEYGITILVHWGKVYSTAREKADAIYNLFKERFTSGSYTFWDIRCESGQPRYMEKRNDVHEFVITYLLKVNI